MKSQTHIKEDELIGYLYRTINDAERETIDDHLLNCTTCRSILAKHEILQRTVDTQIRAEINGKSPSNKVSFAGIASRLNRRGLRFTSPGFSMTIPVATTLIGLLFAIAGMWQVIENFPLKGPGNLTGAFPALACFFFMSVSIDLLDRSFTLRPWFILSAVVSFLLWLGTALLGLLNILVIRDIALIASINAGRTDGEISTATILAVFLSAIIYIVVVIGGAEYHYKRIGHPSSWKVYTWTILLQLILFLLPHFIF